MNCIFCWSGKGGYTEQILDDGSDLYYECPLCHDKGKITLKLWEK